MNEGEVAMDENKTLEQARENMKAINDAVNAYENGTMNEAEAGNIVYDRIFGDHKQTTTPDNMNM